MEVTEPRPRMERAQGKSEVERAQRRRAVKKVISGVSQEYTSEELVAASGAAAARRITKKGRGVVMNT